MNRRGTEKPIEIFVALFLILAVALVMLKLFQGQIADKQKELADVQQEQKAQDTKNRVQLACQQKCTDASNNGCSQASLASLCAFGSKNILGPDEFVDLNNDKKLDYDITLLAGVGVCEDRVYCFNMMSSCCSRVISANDCEIILMDYWQKKGLDTDEMFTKQMALTDSSSCTNDPNFSATDNWRALAGYP